MLRPCVLILVAALAGCSSGPAPAPQSREFPGGLTQSRVVDVQLFQHDTELEFTNTTASTLGPGTLWLNRRFSAPLPALEPGKRAVMKLASFVDEFGDHFRPGGFFAAEDPDRIVLAQVESGQPPVLTGLIVVRKP